MADRYLLESGSPDGYLLEDGSGVLSLNATTVSFNPTTGVNKYSGVTLSNANMTAVDDGAGNYEFVRATAAGTGAFQAEVTVNNNNNFIVSIEDGTQDFSVAVTAADMPGGSGHPTTGYSFQYISGNGFLAFIFNGSTQQFPSCTINNGDVLGFAGDTSAGTLKVYLNGTQLGTTITGLTFPAWYLSVGLKTGSNLTANFAGAFRYPQSGYTAYDPETATGNSISGTSSLTFAPSATLLGQGAASGTSTLTFSPSATLLGKGAASGSSSLVFAPSATLLGTGAVSGTSTLVFGPSATLLGKGQAVGSSSIVFSPSGTVLGRGAVVGSSSLVFGGSGTIGVSLGGSSSLTFSSAASLLGRGAVSGTSALSFTAAGSVRGLLLGSTSIAFVSSGTIAAQSQISGTASLSFTVSGTIFQKLWTDISPSEGTWANDNADTGDWSNTAPSQTTWIDQTHSGTWTTVPKTGASWT